MLGLGGATAWYAAQNFIHSYANRQLPANAASAGNSGARVPPWERDVMEGFEDAAQQTKAGNITGAEVQVDAATAEMEEARVRSKAATSDFFGQASADLDDILKAQPDSVSVVKNSDASGSPLEDQQALADLGAANLSQHLTQARIELAAMRSWQQPLPRGTDLAVDAAEEAIQGRAANASGAGASGATPDVTSASLATAGGKLRLPAGHVDIEAPENLAKGEVLDPPALHADFLDASLMPDTSEILLPPESRQLSDNVRVENLTIAGASQTLDGIHWRNVTFIETRLRYEDGPLDLQNVRFLHCTFGFPSDARGAAIASMIALGKTSLTIP
jgi:hypothetical protein